MAQTKLDIVNLALRELGESAIESFDESDVAELADGHYDLVRDSMLMANRWSWLEERVALQRTALAAPPGEPPEPELDGESGQRRDRRGDWRHEYQTPGLTAIVQALYATRDDKQPDTFNWERRGEFIYTDHDAPYARIQVLTSETTFQRLFVNALVLAVGARLAIPITEDAEIATDLERKATRALRDAKRVDAQSQPVQRIQTFPYVRARVGGDRVRYGLGGWPT